MKLVSKEIITLIVNKSKTRTVLKDVRCNSVNCSVAFRTFSTEDTFTKYGLLPYERYFITVTNEENQTTLEVTKEEGNEIYKNMKVKKEFNYEV